MGRGKMKYSLEKIKEIKDVLINITAGKWSVEYGKDGRVWGIESDVKCDDEYISGRIVETDCGFYPPRKNDAEFIAKAPEYIYYLLNVIEELLKYKKETKKKECNSSFEEYKESLSEISYNGD